MKLTDAQVKAAQAKSSKYLLSDGGGLFLEVDSAGRKYWFYRYRFPRSAQGKQRDFRIGPYPRTSLKEARRLRDEQKGLLLAGEDPCTIKRQGKRAQHHEELQQSFETVARDWHGVRSAGTWGERHSLDVLQKLEKDVFPRIGDIPIQQVSTQDCLNILRSIERRGSAEQARKTLGVIGQVMDYATALSLAPSNPAQSLKRGAPIKQTVRHYPCIAWKELPELLQALENNPANAEPQTVRAIKLLMLTFVRPSELIEAKWDEFDLQGRIWTIPAERMKGIQGNRVEHLVPLSNQSVELLHEQQQLTSLQDFVFPSFRSRSGFMSNNTMNKALKDMGYEGRQVPHGFRAFALTHIQEQLKIDFRVADKQLAHKEKNKVTIAYNRAEYWDERVNMMQRWADLLDIQKTL